MNYLQQEFVRRTKKNPSYSLRSFANHLGIHHGTLSQILRGHRPLTKRRQTELADRLQLTPRQRRGFEGASYRQLDEDVFNVVADWYHDAILELTHVDGFKSNSRWISAHLNLSIVEVNAAIERLVRLKLLDTSREPWRDLSDSNTLVYEGNASTSAIRKYQKQLLQLSMAAVDDVPARQRSHTSIVFPISRSRAAEAEEIIRTYRREMVKLLKADAAEAAQNPTSANSVYALQISLFPLSREIKS